MIFRNKISAFVLALVTTLALSACSRSAQANKDLIIGNWQVVGDKSTIEFKPDGTIQGNDDGEDEKGTYKFTDATHLQMMVDLTERGTNSVPGAPTMMTLNCTMAVQDHDNINMSISMSLPGEASDKAESVHFKRIK
jgi:hypothetical protein